MKKLRPFIMEGIVFLVCVTVLVYSLFRLEYISVRWNLMTVASIFLAFGVLLWCFLNPFRRGLLAFLDLCFRCRITRCGRVQKVFPVEGSVFTEKVTKKFDFELEKRYMYILNLSDGRDVSVLSGEYFPYSENVQYTVQYFKFSKVLIDLIPAEKQE